ncbi:hypothetical protein [Neorhizobium sp. P12A]|uniref:hypothetical protein n=1 Tax=Neorhizobium sp. P12A TaxID=2268027 RepID=UPI0011EDBCAC|nr:hypothetical protein [Neorhizobium sp. P12A]
MSNQNSEVVWEQIHGFDSPAEYQRFVCYIEEQAASGSVRELPADPSYGKGLLFGGRWFQDVGTGAVWRLVPPDLPFRGLWEPVVQHTVE